MYDKQRSLQRILTFQHIQGSPYLLYSTPTKLWLYSSISVYCLTLHLSQIKWYIQLLIVDQLVTPLLSATQWHHFLCKSVSFPIDGSCFMLYHLFSCKCIRQSAKYWAPDSYFAMFWKTQLFLLSHSLWGKRHFQANTLSLWQDKTREISFPLHQKKKSVLMDCIRGAWEYHIKTPSA